MKKLTIAIDGYSACGKSTLAKDLAKKFNFVFIDTGAMYRGVTLYALNNNMIDENDTINTEQLVKHLDNIHLEFTLLDGNEKAHLFLNGIDVEKEIRKAKVAGFVSKIATIKEVRAKLVAQQREMGIKGGVVMDGRDVGSVIFPNADLKLFVTADPKVRAERRLKEMKENGSSSTLEEVLQNLQERDHLDKTRSEGPLIQCDDAIELDTTNFTREGQLQYVENLIKEKFDC